MTRPRGENVIFSESHYQWRLNANAWPSREEMVEHYNNPDRIPGISPATLILRHMIKGQITETGEGWVRVLWDNSRGETCHFPDNLEVV